MLINTENQVTEQLNNNSMVQNEDDLLSQHLQSDEIEDDEVIVLEGDNNDNFSQNMLQYFKDRQETGDNGPIGLATNKNLENLEKSDDKIELEECVCRICLGEEEDPIGNPLFSPCMCAGSMGLIHLQCLREWLRQRKIQRQGEVVSTYFWKQLECELCKHRLPIEIELKANLKHQILEYELPVFQPGEEHQYIVLESISSNTSKVVHVLNMVDEDQVTLGRGHDADVRVTDISVSRCHAVIKKSELGFFYIIDNGSKFGTLSLVRQPQLINPSCNNCYQIGKTLIKFQIEPAEYENDEVKKKKMCPCFEKSEDEEAK